MTTGDKIIETIVRQRMFWVSYPDPDDSHIFVWASNASEQIDAIIQSGDEVILLQKQNDFYAVALQRAGAPDSGNPNDLLAWADNIGNNKKMNTYLIPTVITVAVLFIAVCVWLATGSNDAAKGLERGLQRATTVVVSLAVIMTTWLSWYLHKILS